MYLNRINKAKPLPEQYFFSETYHHLLTIREVSEIVSYELRVMSYVAEYHRRNS